MVVLAGSLMNWIKYSGAVVGRGVVTYRDSVVAQGRDLFRNSTVGLGTVVPSSAMVWHREAR